MLLSSCPDSGPGNPKFGTKLHLLKYAVCHDVLCHSVLMWIIITVTCLLLNFIDLEFFVLTVSTAFREMTKLQFHAPLTIHHV